MKHFILAILLLTLMPSCGKIELADELPPETDIPTDKPGEDGPDDPSGQVLQVVNLSEVEDGTEVLVRGYIVGFVAGRSLSNTVFSTEGAVASNIVIADNNNETDFNRCAAVQLLNNTDERYSLNLADNPHLLGSRVILLGIKQKYYYKPGIKPLYDYEFCEDDPDSDEPDTPTPPPANNYPTLSTEAPSVFEGC